MIIDISQIGNCLKFRPCCPAIKHKGAQSYFSSAFIADKIRRARNKRQSNDMWEVHVEKEGVLLVDGFCQGKEGEGQRGCCVNSCNFKKIPH